jgi:hypothetical protein
VPPAGIGYVGFAFEAIDNTGHLLTDGTLVPDGKSVDLGVDVEIGYAFSNRVSVSGSIPYVSAKYNGPGQTPFTFLPVDSCFCWHSGWQDFTLTARYNIVNKPALGMTPSISIGVPSHAYNFRGEAVIGHRLKQMQAALAAGRRLDQISPKLSIQGRYAYTLVERVLQIQNDRSNIDVEGAFQVTRKLSVRGLLAWQHTHGGLRFGSPPPAGFEVPGDVNTPDRILEHDRLLRDNHWRAGAGVSYTLDQLDVFATYLEYVSGTDAHTGRAVTTGVSWPFDRHRLH